MFVTSYTFFKTGIKRLVGNRANIFLENAVIMYYMAEYYMEYCHWIVVTTFICACVLCYCVSACEKYKHSRTHFRRKHVLLPNYTRV